MNALLNGSFTQTEKHDTKTDRFKVITPAEIQAVMDRHGFDLVGLQTGRAKNPDRANFQTTTAKYRSRDGFDVLGCKFDITFKVPHLYGALIGMIGIFRLVCLNGLIANRDFAVARVPHLERPVEELDRLIPMLIDQRQKLVDQVKAMQSHQVTKQELAKLAESVGKIRLGGIQNIETVQYSDLLNPRRNEDMGSDLFTVLNVLQENAIRHGLRYSIRSVNEETGEIKTRNYNARRVNEASVKAIDLNASIWGAAAEILKNTAA